MPGAFQRTMDEQGFGEPYSQKEENHSQAKHYDSNSKTSRPAIGLCGWVHISVWHSGDRKTWKWHHAGGWNRRPCQARRRALRLRCFKGEVRFPSLSSSNIEPARAPLSALRAVVSHEASPANTQNPLSLLWKVTGCDQAGQDFLGRCFRLMPRRSGLVGLAIPCSPNAVRSNTRRCVPSCRAIAGAQLESDLVVTIRNSQRRPRQCVF